jgi:hypothetical protein
VLRDVGRCMFTFRYAEGADSVSDAEAWEKACSMSLIPCDLVWIWAVPL